MSDEKKERKKVHVGIKTLQRDNGLWYVEVRSDELPDITADHGPFSLEEDAEQVAINLMHTAVEAAKRVGAINVGVVSGTLGKA